MPVPVPVRPIPASQFVKQRGATLIEILVALLILSFGLLGLSVLQVRALKGNLSSFQRSQAVIFNQYMLDLMRVDRENARGGSYNTPQICNPAAIAGASLAQNSLREWLTAVKANVGTAADLGSCVSVTCNVDYECTVRIHWDDSRAGGEGNQILAMSSRV